MYRTFIKPLADSVLSLIGFVLALPLFVSLAVLLFIVNRDSPFFIQQRPGKNGRTFKLIKFKTMNDRRDDMGELLPDSLRITAFGRFLRKTSLDEMPQLINVIKGDMSLVGPRPLLVEYLPLYNQEQARRHEVRPGIIGWAQVNGRNAISWEQKFEYDVWYVDHLSFALDVKICFMAVTAVLKREGIGQDGSETMERFHGTS